MKNQESVDFEIVVYSGDDNILTNKSDGEMYFYNTCESERAFEHYKSLIIAGYTFAYFTVQKHFQKDGEWHKEEYGNDLPYCFDMDLLPQDIQNNIGHLVDFVCPDFEKYEEAKAFFQNM